MEIKIFFLFIYIGILFGCGRQNTNKQSIEDISNTNDMSISDYEKDLYIINFEETLSKSKEHSDFCINDLAKDITFIPLETGGDSPFLNYHMYFTLNMIDDYFIITSGVMDMSLPASLYDSSGHFIKNLIHRGRGPKELFSILSHANTNDSLKTLSVLGETKIVTYSFKENMTKDIPLDKFMNYATLLNDGNCVVLPAVHCSDEAEPYLQFINNKGKVIKSLTYPKGTEEKSYQIKQGDMPRPKESYTLSSNYNGHAIFKDVFNDTIYQIENLNDIKPYIILNRNSLLPKAKDVYDQNAKDKTVYIYKIAETQKYFFIQYVYQTSHHMSIWSKHTCEMIANYQPIKGGFNSFNIFATYKAPDGRDIKIGLENFTKDKIYGVMTASDASSFLENVAEDDNPVLMVIDLK